MALDAIEGWVRWAVAAAGIATLILALWRGVWRGLQRPRGRTTGAGDKTLRTPILAVLAVLWVGVCVLLWRPIPVKLLTPTRVITLILGVSLTLPGLALYWWGARTLGEMYMPSSGLGVILNAEHRLVIHGPFALVRHPLYLGLRLAALGGLLIFRTWALVFVTASFAALVIRARREEEALAAEFGEAWTAYVRRVPGWIPRLRRCWKGRTEASLRVPCGSRDGQTLEALVKRESPQVNGRRIGLFLALTFALSWGFAPLMDALTGRRDVLELGIAPWSMLVPAAVALSLQLFLFRDSPIHIRRFRERAALIPATFLGLTVLYGLTTVLALAIPEQARVLSSLSNLLTTLWTLSLFWLYRQVGEGGFRRVGIPLGNRDRGFRFAVGVVLFLLSQAALNLLLGLGRLQGIRDRVYDVPVPAVLYPFALVVAFGLAVTGTPLGGLAVTFGEEYAWRGFLQAQLFRLGRRRGALLVGLVWGIWHFPVILSGVHTYPPTALGLLLALVFFALWGVVQSYAVLKTGSVWVAAFLHGLVNSVYAYTLTYLVRPTDMVFCFGLGIYGLLCLGLIVWFILRDPVWQTPQP